MINTTIHNPSSWSYSKIGLFWYENIVVRTVCLNSIVSIYILRKCLSFFHLTWLIENRKSNNYNEILVQIIYCQNFVVKCRFLQADVLWMQIHMQQNLVLYEIYSYIVIRITYNTSIYFIKHMLDCICIFE